MRLATAFSENPELSIHATCGHAKEGKAAYRFFQNPKITPGQILSGEADKTLKFTVGGFASSGRIERDRAMNSHFLCDG